jgi:predicted enzyme related to lactoylglutathione lyase
MSTTVQTRIGQVVWHDLMTTDVERARAFYGELLGWEVEVWKPGEMDYPMITVNGQMHGGFATLDPASGAPPHWIAYVRVDDVDAASERAAGAGGSVAFQPMDIPEVGRFSVIADQQGAVIATFSPGDEMTLPQGVFVWDELLTSDVEAAKSFYETVFGWQNRTWEGPNEYTLFQNADAQDVAGVMDKPAEDPGPPRWLTYLATDDLDATVEKARGLGATVYLERMDLPEIGSIAVLADPTGAAFGLFKTVEQ